MKNIVNENGNENRNENVNDSSIVDEVIRTIFFFLRENFISIKSIKAQKAQKDTYKQTKIKKRHLKKKSLVCLFTSYALHIKNI